MGNRAFYGVPSTLVALATSHADLSKIVAEFRQLPGYDEADSTLAFSFKYSQAHMYSSTAPLFIYQNNWFDTIPAGYLGPLYLEVSPRTFPVLVRAGSRLSQMRFRHGEARLDDTALLALHQKETLVAGVPHIANGIAVTIDLGGTDGIVGYRAKRHTGVIDVDKRGRYDPADFWEPIARHRTSELILDPDQFYILVSREAVHVPPDYAAEMVPFDPLVGEFRVHYAGFFDPGFGHSAAGGRGSRAVLEVRSHEVPFILEDGQVVGRLVYERLTARPDKLYGEDLGSNYQAQGLKLSKHFRPFSPTGVESVIAFPNP